MCISIFTVPEALGAGNTDPYSDSEEKDLSGSSTVPYTFIFRTGTEVI